MTKVVSVVLLMCLAAGCALDRVQNTSSKPRTQSKQWTEVDVFGWGGATFRSGMTKDEALDQIKKSGLQKYKGRFGIKKPSGEVVRNDVWRLSCGNGSGAAPGWAGVRLTFRDNKIVKIEKYTGPMPA